MAGNWRIRLRNFAIVAAGVVVLCLYANLTNFFKDPQVGIVLIILISVGWAVVITELSTGLRNKKALYSALSVAALGAVLYLPMLYFWQWANDAGVLGWPVVLLMFVIGLVVSAGIGFAWGGPDRTRSARTAALTAIPVSMLLFIDRLMQSWSSYNDNQADQGAPDRHAGQRHPQPAG